LKPETARQMGNTNLVACQPARFGPRHSRIYLARAPPFRWKTGTNDPIEFRP
jgi:hypothetical protein